LTKELFGPF
jgi:1-pyrroline-5-carboxylate dehydrogenase